MRAVAAESATLRAIAAFNGRAKYPVFVYSKADATIPVLTEDLNLAASSERDALIAKAPAETRPEMAPLLAQLAAAVASEATAPPKTRRGDAKPDPFPAMEPWPVPVDGVALLNDLRTLLSEYVVLPQHAGDAIALWVLHTYVADVADYSPYVLVTSPVKECGKTTLLELLARLAYRAQMSGGITAAALYRRIDRYSPTMLLDELDTRLRGDGGEYLRGVLNTGFQRGGKVTICVGEEHEDRDFNTFCPKVLAGIGRVWDTVTSRSIPIRLARASKEELAKLTKIRGDRIAATCDPYRQRLRRWADDSRELLNAADPETPHLLSARQSDVWRMLLAIADVAGGDWPKTARAAALALHGHAEEEGDYGLLVLEDVRRLFEERRTSDGELPSGLASAMIVQELLKMEDRPWPEYPPRYQPISTRGLAALLGRFGAKPKTVRVGVDTPKGYALDELAPAFKTYLPPIPPVPSATSATEGESSDVADVADRNGGMGPVLLPGDVVSDGEGGTVLTDVARERLRADRAARRKAAT